jgi:hypothetical protein
MSEMGQAIMSEEDRVMQLEMSEYNRQLEKQLMTIGRNPSDFSSSEHGGGMDDYEAKYLKELVADDLPCYSMDDKYLSPILLPNVIGRFNLLDKYVDQYFNRRITPHFRPLQFQDEALHFDSLFEGGNLFEVRRSHKYCYELILCQDFNAEGF